jgi:oxygen-dependent protoporphyrinogen oxidase
VLQTIHQDGYLIEGAADGFLTTPAAAVDLCRRVGLESQLIGPDAAHRQALVVHRGKLQPIPQGFVVMAPSKLRPLLTTPILSWRGKLRAASELMVPRGKADVDESLESFVCRRFGRELFERLVQPLMGGIYTADPARLSIDATMPRFRKMEREHGSLLRAMLRNRQPAPATSGARYGQFATLQAGMAALVEALTNRLPPDAVRLQSPLQRMTPLERGGWRLEVGGVDPQSLTVDGLIVAGPAHQAAKLIAGVDDVAAAELKQIEYASCAVVSLGYSRSQIGHPLDAFGFVVPLVEERTILSCSFSSVKYPGRAPAESVLLRVFVGGACQSGLLQLTDQQITELAEREVGQLLQIRGEPRITRLVRQHRAMPQYHVGHVVRVASIEDRLKRFPTLALAGSALHGVGVPGCIQTGEAAANRVVENLAKHPQPQLQSL